MVDDSKYGSKAREYVVINKCRNDQDSKGYYFLHARMSSSETTSNARCASTLDSIAQIIIDNTKEHYLQNHSTAITDKKVDLFVDMMKLILVERRVLSSDKLNCGDDLVGFEADISGVERGPRIGMQGWRKRFSHLIDTDPRFQGKITISECYDISYEIAQQAAEHFLHKSATGNFYLARSYQIISLLSHKGVAIARCIMGPRELVNASNIVNIASSSNQVITRIISSPHIAIEPKAPKHFVNENLMRETSFLSSARSSQQIYPKGPRLVPPVPPMRFTVTYRQRLSSAVIDDIRSRSMIAMNRVNNDSGIFATSDRYDTPKSSVGPYYHGQQSLFSPASHFVPPSVVSQNHWRNPWQRDYGIIKWEELKELLLIRLELNFAICIKAHRAYLERKTLLGYNRGTWSQA